MRILRSAEKTAICCTTLAVLFVCAVFAAACAPAEENEFFTVEINYQNEMGSVTISQPEHAEGYAKDEKVTVKVVPKSGYEVDSFTVNGAQKTLSLGEYTFNVSSNTVINVTFKETSAENYTVTVGEYDRDGGNVMLSPASLDGKYKKGEKVTLTVTANQGYEIKSVTVNGKAAELDDSGAYLFSVEGDTSIAVVFEKKASAETFTVTVGEYDKDGGNAVPSPASLDGKYEKGTEVTLTVTANQGYEIKSVTVNGKTAQLDENGRVTFTVEENISITVVFQERGTVGNVKFDEEFCREWKSADGKHTLKITENEFELDGIRATAVQKGSDAGGVYYNVRTEKGNYILSWLEGQTGNVLKVWDEKNGSEELFIENTENLLGALGSIDINVQGIWGYDDNGDEEIDPEPELNLKIDSQKVFMDGETSEVVIYTGYVGTSSEKLYNYLFYLGGEAHTFKWVHEEIGYYLTLDGKRLARNRSVVYLNDIYQGSWNEIGGESVISVTESKITIDGEEVEIGGVYGAYDVTWKGTVYEFSLDSGNEDLLFLSDVKYDENGLILSVKNLYFLRAGVELPSVRIGVELFGAWTSAGQDNLVITENGIAWGAAQAIILSLETGTNSVTILAIIRGTYCEIRYLGGDVLYLSAPGISHEFMREIEGRGEKGFLDLTIGVYTLGGDARLTVKKDSLTVYDAIRDTSITLTLSDLNNTAQGYEFTWKEFKTGDGTVRDQPMILVIGKDASGKTILTLHDTTTTPDEEGEYNYSVIYTFTLG